MANVRDNAEKSRFELDVEGEVASPITGGAAAIS